MLVIILIVVGVCLGSFVNALVWRLHKQQTLSTQKQKKKYSITTGRSMCFSCKHVLAPQDLMPVFSWLSLGGKCRYCRAPIPDTPVAEVLVPLLFVVSYYFWPTSLGGIQWIIFGCWLAYIVIFVALSIYDIKWQLLPNVLIIALLCVVILQILVMIPGTVQTISMLLNMAGGGIVGGGIFYVIFQISGGKWIGGGDVKLGLALGLIVGSPQKALLIIFLASLIGTIVALPGLVRKNGRLSARLPFGPYLIVAAILSFLFGQTVIDAYLRLAGL